MTVDIELQTFLVEMNGPPLSEIPLELLREGGAVPTETPPEVANVVNRTIPGPAGDIPVRLYYPSTEKNLPILVYFHGGGFVLCNLDTHDSLCRSLALGADCIVMSVDYRLAPEHPFPAAPEDSLAATKWVMEHAGEIGGDADRIIVGGDSAGGNLATVVARRFRDEGTSKIRGQLLIYPVTQLRPPMEGSMAENGDGYFLKSADMAWFEDMYLGDTDPGHPDASPLLVDDLGNLPPALVITAGYDPLRDQGQAYAVRLSEAGNSCDHSHYAGAIHGFFGMPAEISRRAIDEACSWLKATYASAT